MLLSSFAAAQLAVQMCDKFLRASHHKHAVGFQTTLSGKAEQKIAYENRKETQREKHRKMRILVRNGPPPNRGLQNTGQMMF